MRGLSAAKKIEPQPEVFEVPGDFGHGLTEPGWYVYHPNTGENTGPFPSKEEAEATVH